MDSNGNRNIRHHRYIYERIRHGRALSVELVNAPTVRSASDYVLASAWTVGLVLGTLRRIRLVGWRSKPHTNFGNRMTERFGQMTPEQRAKFREGLSSR